MTTEENLKYSKHKEIKGKKAYDKYDNYDAIEVPFTDSIPGDYKGIMGVPISFLDKYNPDQFEVRKLFGDPYIKNRKGIFEYVLGGSVDTKLLDVRVFDEATKKAVYATQITKAEKKGESNCPHCAIGHDANKSKIWNLSDMDADHVAVWSKGGATAVKNCQMLCKTHNRAKGNR